MRVIGCCTYPTAIPYRRIEHDAHDFIQAVKGRPLHGYTGVLCRGVRRVVLNINLDRALEILALLTSDITEPPMPVAAPVLIPIPNGSSTLSAEPPRTFTQAQFVAQQFGEGAEAIDLFRWRYVMPSANNAGGTREPDVLYEALVVRPNALAGVPPGHPFVLIDDVLTTGGHLQACDAALEDLVGRRAAVALVAGISDDEHVEDPFLRRVIDLSDFEPQRRRKDW